MSPDDILDMQRARPFVPFRIHMSDGSTYDIHHPEHLLVLRTRIAVAVGSRDGVPAHMEQLSLYHVVRIAEIHEDAAA